MVEAVPTAPDARRRRLALAVLLAPAAWVVHLSAGVALVPLSCERGTDAWLHLTTVVALIAAVAGAGLSRRALRRAADGDGDGRHATDRFVARLGWWGALFLTGLVLVEGLLVFPLEACG